MRFYVVAGYFQRYVAHLPSAGEMAIFDRSWGEKT